jgi:methylenetetrahydrofolate reductase (NADPH)
MRAAEMTGKERSDPGPILKRYSIEITARDSDALHAALGLLPKGCEVFVADLPHQEPEILIETCVRLRTSGLEPVPHLVARNLRGAAALNSLLKELAGEAGVDRAFILGGDREAPVGPFRDALQLIESGVLQTQGLRRIALACFPEGHPRIGDDELQEALRAKLAAAKRAGLPVLLVSQFAFEAQPVLDLVRRLRAAGVSAPFRVGIAGPADRKTLRRFGRELGAGDSIHVLDEADDDRRPAAPGEESPYALLSELAAAQAADPILSIEGAHFFAFGSTAKAIRWAQALQT